MKHQSFDLELVSRAQVHHNGLEGDQTPDTPVTYTRRRKKKMVEGESSRPPTAVADSKAALQCPMLTATNYNIWAIRIKAVFRVHGILDALEPKEGTPVDDKQDHMAVALLFQAIPEELVFQVSQFNIAKEI